jgi:septation ring formation regulator EzrA
VTKFPTSQYSAAVRPKIAEYDAEVKRIEDEKKKAVDELKRIEEEKKKAAEELKEKERWEKEAKNPKTPSPAAVPSDSLSTPKNKL